jgi:hypothetical protein
MHHHASTWEKHRRYKGEREREGERGCCLRSVDVTVKLHNNDVGIWRVAADTRSAYTQFDFRCVGAFACELS